MITNYYRSSPYCHKRFFNLAHPIVGLAQSMALECLNIPVLVINMQRLSVIHELRDMSLHNDGSQSVHLFHFIEFNDQILLRRNMSRICILNYFNSALQSFSLSLVYLWNTLFKDANNVVYVDSCGSSLILFHLLVVLQLRQMLFI